ncbi:MAG: UDP-N-acetylglucosamine--N-acetylmuramyl-(pentapeptide) pyrophosphoryl-undecaprenol N-acetylglucosamine transferase, partial [Phycisphaerae bacterium]
LGLGGFAAGPVVREAARRGVPAGLLNPDAVPGIANRFLAGKVDVIFTQFEPTAERFPDRLRGRIRCVGCPLRHGFGLAAKDEALEHFGLRPGRKTLLVFGGSLVAESLVRATVALAGRLAPLADAWQLLVVARDQSASDMRHAYESTGVNVVTLSYCDRMDLAYEAADLALTRCGAGTAAELAVSATPAVIFPYPYHRDQQQKLNAAELENAGAAVVLDDAVDAAVNADALERAMLPIMRDPARLGAMRQAAEHCARPHAAREVARWLHKPDTG